MAPPPGKLDEFREAVRALSADPDASNIDRYLAASRELDDVRAGRRPREVAGATRS
jgi:hypothetical protein